MKKQKHQKSKSKDNVLDTVQKLLGVVEENGATMNEYLVATNKITALLAKHNLTMQHVTQREVESQVINVENKLDYAKVPSWLVHLASKISKALNCRIIYSGYHDHECKFGTRYKQKLNIIGYKLDAEIAAYFIETLVLPLWTLADKEAKVLDHKGHKLRLYRSSYIIGAAEEIAKRLTKKEPEAKERDLVIVKSKAVANKVNKLFPDLESSSGRSTNVSPSGYGDGKEGGKNIPLTPGIKTNGDETKQLTNTK